MSRYGKLTAWLIAAWLVFSVGASALHLYHSDANRPPLALRLAALTPIAIFFVWFAGSRGFREFALSLSPRVLTLVQSWRVAGFVFLVLATYGILPKVFALSAGWGDITIGATATFAALMLARPEHRTSFLVWQALGITDLVMAVGLGSLAGVIDPLSPIPTFAVPLLLMLHIICIAQALRWPVQERRIAPELHSPAA
jgi:hypothetical protein